VSAAAGPDAWLTVSAAAQICIRDLGYEDEGELEDALRGSLASFIDAMPHLDYKIQDEPGVALGKPVFRLRPPPPAAERYPRKVTLRVRSSQDLWRVLIKQTDCIVEVPHLEFELSPDRRQIDTLYNHLTRAIFNLGGHARLQGVPENHRAAIVDTVEGLSAALDCAEEYDIVIHDPSGLSTLHPETGCEVEKLGESLLELGTELPETA
jgi:hypothetical protein